MFSPYGSNIHSIVNLDDLILILRTNNEKTSKHIQFGAAVLLLILLITYFCSFNQALS